MPHGLLSKLGKPPKITTEDIASVGAGTILGSFNQLGDLGFVGNPTTGLGISDTVRTDVSRGRPPKQDSTFEWNIFPDRKPDENRPVVPFIDIPTGSPPPEYPLLIPPAQNTFHAGEALQARDTLSVKVQRGTNDTPVIVHKPRYAAQINFKLGDAVSYKGHKKYYVTKTHYRKTGSSYKKHHRVPPCTALNNEGFSLERRKHKRTGNSSSQLRQIRRTYAYRNCK